MLWGKIVSLTLVFLSSFVCQTQTQGCGDCCSNTTYTAIDEPRRSTKAVWSVGEKAFCDRGLRWGWYRFTSYTGGKIPEKIVPENRCGTHAPIWLNGGHPTNVGENVVRQACIHFFGIGCLDSFDINITNCGDYFVYYLKPPLYCSVAFCAGDKEPCPYGKEGVFPECFDLPQEFSSENLGDPKISFIPDEEQVDVTLLCSVKVLNGIDNWQNVSYRIEWFAEGESLQSKLLDEDEICGGLPNGAINGLPCPGEDGELVSKLSGTKYKIGQWISCNVSAKFTTSPKNVWSKSKAVREPFFAGIQVYPRATTLTFTTCSLSITTITITPTIPARRNHLSQWPRIIFWLPEEIQLVDNERQCEIELRGTNPISLKIKATCPATGATEGLKAIVPEISNLHSTFWNRFKVGLPTIWVRIFKPAADTLYSCTSVTDPHYRALEGRYFDFMGLGDYILYRNTERNFEVQTRQWSCGFGPSCNCGAVLRDHNDVIAFSCCNDLLTRDVTTPITVTIRSKKCLAPGISIRNIIQGVNGQYEVMFPSGAKVLLTRNYWGLDVKVETPRASDRNNEKGICLYSGGDINSYGNSLRLQPKDSFFDTLPPDVDGSLVDYSKACLCPNDGAGTVPQCKNVFDAAFPTLVENNMERLSPTQLCDRDKRDLHYSDHPTEEDLQLFKQTPHLRDRIRREAIPEAVSKENATRYCAERISETKIGQLCAKVGVNVQALVNTCSSDIQYTGDFSFATGSVALLMNECGELGARNLSALANYSSEETPSVDTFVEQMAELLCPNDCMFNGKCVNGSCVCSKGYTAVDCSISIYQIPTITRLQGDGLCDRRNRPCKKVTVFGTDFLNSTNLTCHVKEFKVVSSPWTPNNTVLKFPGVMTDLVLADCYLPESPVTPGYFRENDEGTPAAGLMISVSNDGEHESVKNLTLISYDPACMSCNISSGCTLKNNSCFINRYCFAPNDTNPIDWCYQCLPDVSKNSWTKRKVNLPPTFPSTTQYFAVLQEILELPVDFIDPEGMPVTVSLVDGSPSEAEVRDNVLIWNVTNNAKTVFFLKATDTCEAISYVNITVTLDVCGCQNNGSCVPHPNKPRGSGYYECQCIPGYTGEYCETDVDECQSYPCFRGRCIDGPNKYTCICDPGYVGSNCDTDYDDCSHSPCIHGKCTDYTGAYKCTCDPGYSGANCTIDIDDCESSPCIHGDCDDQVSNYTCECHSGYTGHDCEVEIDECRSSPCIRGTCQDVINNYTCICPAGYTGGRCEENIDNCLSTPCRNGTCIDLVNNYTCNCHVGFTGSHCDIEIKNCTIDSCYPNVTCFKNSETISCGPCPVGLSGDGKNCEDIDYCVNHTCTNGGSCVDGISNYSCSCPAGYTDDHCETDIDDCVIHTCINGGTCEDGVNKFSCNCLVGFTGSYCEIDIDNCVNHTCSNGGSCEDGVNSYTCNCSVGFTGDHCETDMDDCINHTCSNGGTCEDGINSYSCNCPLGFIGNYCQTDIDDCVNHTCTNNGSCEDGVNSYSCNCPEGYTGDHCETDIDYCVNHTCINGGTCEDGVNNYSCNCKVGFTGSYCEIDMDDCFNHTCSNGGTCEDGIHSYSCNCPLGFTGNHCETDIDDCVNHTCSNNGSCEDGVNSYSCNCPKGYTGDHCETDIDYCINHTCQNGASCVDGFHNYSCKCATGYTGSNCETDIDYCVNHTCVNGGTCEDDINNYSCNCIVGFTGNYCEIDIDDCFNHTCSNGGTCKDGINSYSCNCPLGLTGNHCETDIDYCINHTCQNGASCVESLHNYSCKCAAGYTGSNCETDIDYCVNHMCINGGTCEDGVNNYSCNCIVGFTGNYCEIDIDNCVNHTCGNGGSCEDGVNSYTCNCSVGFTGDHCETDINDCFNHTCSNGGTCEDGINSYSCNCPTGFTGNHCETDIDYCINHTCQNGASCVDGLHNYSCTCPTGYTGSNCETDIDDCINHTCSNGGTCEDGINSHSCNCPLGFTGNHCETDIDDCVNHACSNNGSCEDGVNSYFCNCPEGYTGDHCETDIDYCINHTCQNGAACVDGLHNYSCTCPTGYTGSNCETDIDYCINHTCQNGASCVDGLHNYSCTCPTGYTGSNCETGLPSPSISAKIVTTTHVVSTSRTHTTVPSTSTGTRISSTARSPMQGTDTSVLRLPSFTKVSTRLSSVVTNIPIPDKKATTVAVQPTSQQVISSSSVVTDISSSVKESTTVTVQPTTPRPQTKLVVELRIQRTWNKDLENKSSQAFKELSRTLETQITAQYSQEENFVEVEILSFRPGSVVAQFRLLFKNILEDEKALNPLQKAVEDGNLGNLTVDPESLRIIKDVEDPTEESNAPYPVIIGVSCVGIFVLAVLVIFLIRYCHRRKMLKHRRESDVMPVEVAFPNPERYQLQETI